MPERGEINNRNRAKQLRNFKKMKWGKITPTDIDMSLDFHNKLFILGETKLEGKSLDIGQRLNIERINDCINNSGKKCYALITEHNVTDYEQDINFDETIVIEYRINKKWVRPQQKISAKEAIDKLRKINNITEES